MKRVTKSPDEKIIIRHHDIIFKILAKPTIEGFKIKSINYSHCIKLNKNTATIIKNKALAPLERGLLDLFDNKKKLPKSIQLDLDGCSSFEKNVLIAAKKIPWGKTVSYSELAVMAGHPNAVRAAAAVMRNNCFAFVVPCHRVIAKNGKIGGFMGKKKGPCVELKKKLLLREGVNPVGLFGVHC
jgi:methylated-DNA-[protein]-cysteine S-methyltransferase